MIAERPHMVISLSFSKLSLSSRLIFMTLAIVMLPAIKIVRAVTLVWQQVNALRRRFRSESGVRGRRYEMQYFAFARPSIKSQLPNRPGFSTDVV